MCLCGWMLTQAGKGGQIPWGWIQPVVSHLMQVLGILLSKSSVRSQ